MFKCTELLLIDAENMVNKSNEMLFDDEPYTINEEDIEPIE